MRNIFGLLAFCLFWASCASAEAATFTGGNITTHLPEGWKAEANVNPKALSEVKMRAADNTYGIDIAFLSSSGQTSEMWAAVLAKGLKADPPVESHVPGLYGFAKPDKSLLVVLTASENRVLLITERGDSRKHAFQIRAIALSLTSPDLEEQQLLDKVKRLFPPPE